jgi:uncharacterized protein (TIGR03067 family)
MRMLVLLVLASLLSVGVSPLPAADADKEDAVKKDLEALTGTWAVIHAERDGQEVPKEDLKKMRLVQDHEQWEFRNGEEVVEGTDMLDPIKTPKQSDSKITKGPDKGKTALGIYSLDGDLLRSCWADPGKERPTEFGTKPNSGQNYLILKREKAK